MNFDINPVASVAFDGDIAQVILDSPPVNALSHGVREGIYDGLARALENGAKAVVLLCRGRTFFAGADISEFDHPMKAPELSAVLDLIEGAPVPVIAAIHGTALGGGLEVSLACHYRIAVPSAKLGLPEVALGLLPGAGGTQRTPRLAGIDAAIDLIAGGKPVSAARGLELGLLDCVLDEGDLPSQAVRYAAELVARAAPLKRARDAVVDLSPVDAQAAADAYLAKYAARVRGFKAPGNILKAIVAAAELPFDRGMIREAELFQELMQSRESAAQRYIFFAERGCAKIPGLAKDVALRPIQRTAVIGAGTMGSGIAIALLNGGFEVKLIDLNADALAKAKARIEKTITGLAAKGAVTQDEASKRVSRLTTTSELAAVADADLIVEAVFERMSLKQAVFKEIDGIAKPGAILATNTSFLDVDAIAAATSRPSDVVGLHFFAPANIMRLLEVVRGAATSPDVLATAMNIGRKLGKLAVVSGVCDGFIANRLMTRRQEVADRLILQGPQPADIDRVMVDYGFPMGPFQMMDLVGLDVIGWDKQDSAGRTVQEVLCEAGHWGQKTGVGYYDYTQGPPIPAAAALSAIETIRTRHAAGGTSPDDEQLLHLLLDPVVNEGAKLVEEGIVYRAADIDMALIAGYGWPAYTGGPMFWGDTVGLDAIVTRLHARAAAGEPIAVSALLEQYAADDKTFVR